MGAHGQATSAPPGEVLVEEIVCLWVEYYVLTLCINVSDVLLLQLKRASLALIVGTYLQ